MKRWLQIGLPVLVLAVGVLISYAMIASKTEPETVIPEVPHPVVRVQTVTLEDRQMKVHSQGTVSPRTVSVLVPEVSGRVIEVSPAFVSGGFFEKDEVLLRIDPLDYRTAVVEAAARVTQAELRLAVERAEADLAVQEWTEIGTGEPTSLTRHEPQIVDAQAGLAAARAALDRAERNLERTSIRAPYSGRVRTKEVDLGQFVNRGAALATLYAVDFAEIELPLPDADLAFVDLPLVYRGQREGTGPEVTLRADFAGGLHEWSGRIVRTEGQIDPRTRMVHAVARVSDPYGRGDDPNRPPLAAGMFVEAEIFGRVVRQVAVIPRSALRNGNQVLIVDDEDRLRFREVEVLRKTQQEAIISSGLTTGEQLCLTSLSAVTDGMRVRRVS